MRRREFLTVGAAASVAAAGGTMVWRGSQATQFNRARFEGWLAQEFRLTAQGALRSVAAVLVAIEDAPGFAGRRQPRLEQFQVLFRGAKLPTGLAQFAHRDGTQFSLHLDTVDAQTRRATFSLLEQVA